MNEESRDENDSDNASEMDLYESSGSLSEWASELLYKIWFLCKHQSLKINDNSNIVFVYILFHHRF